MKKKILRLLVASLIKNTDAYYQALLESQGVDITKLTHTQIAAWKASLKVIEADILIDAAFTMDKVYLKDVNVDFFPK
jgi:hypothetical protein